jgi:hypothetical protein
MHHRQKKCQKIFELILDSNFAKEGLCFLDVAQQQTPAIIA